MAGKKTGDILRHRSLIKQYVLSDSDQKTLSELCKVAGITGATAISIMKELDLWETWKSRGRKISDTLIAKAIRYGDFRTLDDLAEILGVSRRAIWQRLKNNPGLNESYKKHKNYNRG